MALRRSDVTDMTTSTIDRFQTRMLDADGVVERIDFDSPIDCGSWDALFSAFDETRLVIVECEFDRIYPFTLGRCVGSDREHVHIASMDGHARFESEPIRIACDAITAAQWGTRYTAAYERQLARTD